MKLRSAKLLLVFNTIILFVVAVVAAVVFVGGYTPFSEENSQQSGQGEEFSGQDTPELDSGESETMVAFSELTIPYLRNRSYESSLGELQQISQNGNYSSYLTSYDSDGLSVNGLVTRPNGDMPASGWPAIVFVHGYIPPASYQTTENYEDYVDYLARNGFVVFKIDLRGHGNSEGSPGGAYYSGDYAIDTLNARAALRNSGFVNPEKIGFWGHSMGGNVVFRSFVAAQDVPAVVIWAGAVYTYEDMREFGIDDNSYRPPSQDSERRQERTQLRETHGDFDAENPFWQQVVPTNYLRGVVGAVQLNHAVNDNVVSIDYSRNLSSILDGTSIEHELNEMPGGGHNISGSNFTAAMEQTVDFYREQM